MNTTPNENPVEMLQASLNASISEALLKQFTNDHIKSLVSSVLNQQNSHYPVTFLDRMVKESVREFMRVILKQRLDELAPLVKERVSALLTEELMKEICSKISINGLECARLNFDFPEYDPEYD